MMLNLLELFTKTIQVATLPVSLQIELTTHCNLECSICPSISAQPAIGGVARPWGAVDESLSPGDG
jgi:MoaA/NifB/PqqE/SkfB family radical SAM enzyme